MSKILIFAGTTEGRKLSEHLCERGIEHTVFVATEYGEIVLHDNPFAHVHMGRMDSEGMRSFFAEQKCELIVDATHPYAAIVTENIKQAVYVFNEAHAVTDNQADSSISENIEYVRLKRDTDISADYDNIRYFEDNEACAKALNNTDGNILLTTGSKELSVYCKTSDVRERLYVRVLPGLESISLCMHNDITGKLPQKIKIFRSILWGKACRMMECHLKLFVNILTVNITSFISCLPALEWEMMLA